MAFLENENRIIHYEWLDQGHSNTLILINSLGTNLMIWNKVVPGIRNQFNILMFDKRGHGLSTTSGGQCTIDDYADDVILLMDELGISSAHVMGLSIGGLIVYSLASRYPDRFEKLMFSNTGAKIGTREAWNERIENIQEVGIQGTSKAIIERWLSKSYRKQHPAETKGYALMLEQNDPKGYIQACEAIRDANYHPVLDKIPHDAMFIGGSADAGTTPEFVAENASRLPSARLEIMDGVGHLPCIEVPEKVAALILDFCLGGNQSSLYERGMRTRRSVLGDAHVDRAEVNKTDFDKDFQEYIVNSAWGSIWSRPHLTKRERSLITLALLASLGHYEELEMHIRACANTGASTDDIKEVFLHTGVYAGVPVTNNAMKIAKKILDSK